MPDFGTPQETGVRLPRFLDVVLVLLTGVPFAVFTRSVSVRQALTLIGP